MQYIDRASIKAEARDVIRTGRRSVVGMGVIYMAISLALSGVDTFFTHFGIVGAAFVSVLISLISLVLSAGFVCFCMGVRRGEETPFSALFDGFGMVGKLIWLNILMVFYVTLWTFLFIIPGFIAAYRYRFALYNLLENPDLTASQAIALSKVQTRGMKMELFALDLSFFGWALLSVLTAGILMVWLSPYMQLADLGYYELGKEVISPFPGGHSTYDDQTYDQF